MLKPLFPNSLSIHLLLFFAFISTTGLGQWNGDTLTGGKMSIRGQNLYHKSFAFTDGFGGVIEAYDRSNENGTEPYNYSISLQRTDSTGLLLWGNADSGRVIVQNNANLRMPLLVDAEPDYTGGAYILYNYPSITLTQDSFYLYLQHINQNGIAAWPGNGVLLAAYQNYQQDTRGKITTGNTYGVFAMWENGSAINKKLYVQKFRNDGSKIWNETGIDICNHPSSNANSSIVTDGEGGLITIFMDGRDAIYNSSFHLYNKHGIYAQHIDSSGIKKWGPDGMIAAGITQDSMIITAETDDQNKILFADGEGGCYFRYTKLSGPYNGTSNVQKLTATGSKPWGNYGIGRALLPDGQYLNIDRIYKKPQGGIAAIYLKIENIMDSGLNSSMWLQYFNSDSTAIYNAPKKIGMSYYSFDSGNGLNCDAEFTNNGIANIIFIGDSTKQTLKYQRVLSDGTLLWDSAGKTIIRQKAQRLQVITGKNDNTILRWCDNRNYPVVNERNDMFLTQVDSNGELPAARATVITINNGNWNNPATWLNNIVPGPDDIAVISHTVNVTVNTTCYALSVEQGGNIVVATGVNLTILH
jgi:hypothetical protein